MSNEFNFSNSYDSVYGVDPVPKKKKGAKIAIIAASVLGVAAGGGAAAYNLSPFVKNQVKLRISSPENYSTWVYSENSEAFAKQAADQYRLYIDKLNNGTTVDASVSFEPSAEAIDLIKEEIDEEKASKTLTETSSIALSLSGSSKAGDTAGSMSLLRNNETLATLDFAIDENPYDLFFRVAELNERWLNIDEQSFGDSSGLSLSQKRPEEIITPEEFEAEVKRYTDLWNQYTSDVTVEKKEDVAIEDITVSYTVITKTLTADKANELKNAVVTEMKNDEVLRSILVDRLKSVESAEEYNEMLDRALEEESITYSTAQLDTYVDPNGVVRGMRALVDDEEELDFVYGISGDQVRGKLVSDEGNATLSATKNGNKYTGNLRMDVDDQNFNIDFTDFERTGKDFTFFNADVVVSYSGGEKDQALNFKFTGTEDSQTVVTNIITDGTDYGRITMKMAARAGAEIQIPDKGAAFYIDKDVDYEDYVTNEDIKKFTNSFLEKLGITEEDTADLASSLLYGGMDYDDDYDFEDYDFDEYDLDDYDFDEDSDVSATDQEMLDSSIPVNDGQVYLMVFNSYFDGNVYTDDSNKIRVAKGTTLADVTGPGTYVVSVSSETEEFAKISGTPADEIGVIWLIGEGINGIDENTEIVVDKVLVDGTEVPQHENENMNGPGRIFAILFSADDNDGEAVGKNWKNVEVTFTVK